MSDMFRHVAAGERPHFDAHLPNTPTGWCELMQADTRIDVDWHEAPAPSPTPQLFPPVSLIVLQHP